MAMLRNLGMRVKEVEDGPDPSLAPERMLCFVALAAATPSPPVLSSYFFPFVPLTPRAAEIQVSMQILSILTCGLSYTITVQIPVCSFYDNSKHISSESLCLTAHLG